LIALPPLGWGRCAAAIAAGEPGDRHPGRVRREGLLEGGKRSEISENHTVTWGMPCA
jgi:hypothetical protein